MKQRVITQKILGAFLIVLGVIPFIMLSTNAFPTVGLFQRVVSFRDLLHVRGLSGIWALTGYIYWFALFVGVLIIALGLAFCIMKNSILEKKKIGLPICVATGCFYLFAFIANMVVIVRNGAFFTFYFYTFTKLLIIAILTIAYIIAQKTSKKQDNNQNEKI